MKNSSQIKFKTNPEIWISPESWDSMTKGKPIYRGFSSKMECEIIKISSPNDRNPVHMPKNIQREIDDYFEGEFGIRFRQKSIFSTSSFEIAKSYAGEYGEVRMIRPLEPFCYCWSANSKDLYFEYMESDPAESVSSMISRLNFQIDDMENAINLGNEIMLVGSMFEVAKVP